MNPNDFGDPLTFPLRLSFLVFIEKSELLDECHLVDILGSQKISKNMITTFDREFRSNFPILFNAKTNDIHIIIFVF